jgi:antitoxin component YwqK of YwqJK toxin-antitoxin module
MSINNRHERHAQAGACIFSKYIILVGILLCTACHDHQSAKNKGQSKNVPVSIGENMIRVTYHRMDSGRASSEKLMITADSIFYEYHPAIMGNSTQRKDTVTLRHLFEYTHSFLYFSDIICHIDSNGIEIYKFKKTNEKISNYINFGCEIDGEGGVDKGYEGEGQLTNGRRHGKWKIRMCDSDIKQEIHYNNGLVTGHYKAYRTLYDVKKGEIINFYRDRKKIKYRDTILYETDFINGNGYWKNFYSDNSIRETGFYEGGKKSGEWRYYIQKQLHGKEYYENGKWKSLYEAEKESGKIKRENFLYKKEYYENGILIKREEFEIPFEYQPDLLY